MTGSVTATGTVLIAGIFAVLGALIGLGASYLVARHNSKAAQALDAQRRAHEQELSSVEWRRDAELPIVARILTISGEDLKSWESAASAKGLWVEWSAGDRLSEDTISRDAGAAVTEAWRAGSSSFDRLRFEVAQLDFMAVAPLRSAARALLASHEALVDWLRPVFTVGTVTPSDFGSEAWSRESDKIRGLENELIVTARADLKV
jgi:hypothetical protein